MTEQRRVSTWESFFECVDEQAVDLHHEKAGKGPAVLMIHGFCTHIYTWRHIRAPLSARFGLRMIDLKGFGRSPCPDDDRYSVYDQAAAVLRYIRRHDLSDFTLVGHSFGGGVALVTALYLTEKMPGRLKKLVLIDSVGYPQPLSPALGIVQIPLLGEAGIRLVNSRLIVKGMFLRAFFDASKVTRNDIDAYAAPFDRPGSRSALLSASRQIVPTDLEELSARYGKIDVPTLILFGREDRVVPLEIGHKLHEGIKGSRLVVLDRCGHVPQEERPEETVEAMLEFLH